MKKLEKILKSLEHEHKLETSDKHWKLTPDHADVWNEELSQKETNEDVITYNLDRTDQQRKIILTEIQKLGFGESFSVLDLCCGSPFFLKNIKEKWPKCKTYGVDVYTTEFKDFEENSKGSKVYKFPFQMLLNERLEEKLDVVLMINSYRAFNKDLQNLIFNWCKINAKYFIYDLSETSTDWYVCSPNGVDVCLGFQIIKCESNQVK